MNLLKVIRFDLINTVKNLILLLTTTVFPLMLIALFGFITKGNYGDRVTSYDYYGVTIIVYSILNVAIITANSFMEKRIKDGNIRLIYSPTSSEIIFLSKILSSFIFSIISFLITLIVAKNILNINYGGTNFIYVYSIIVVITLLTSSFGAFLCCIFKSEEAANKIISPFNSMIALLGGVFFPVDGFGGSVEQLSYLSPVKWVSECIFKIIYDNDFSMFVPLIIISIICSLILMILCKITFKPEEYI